MNHQKSSVPSWLQILLRNPLLFLWVGYGLILTTTIGVIVFIDYRLDQAEDQLVYVPPSTYESPVLEDYAPGDVDPSILPVRQTVYVPVYSHVYFHGGAPYLLETTLSIRNIDPGRPIYLASVEYYDTDGKLVATHLDQTIGLAPLQTIEFLVERRDSSGGSGANFLVRWLGDDQTVKPVVEAVMVGTSGHQAISFVRSGIEIDPVANAKTEGQ